MKTLIWVASLFLIGLISSVLSDLGDIKDLVEIKSNITKKQKMSFPKRIVMMLVNTVSELVVGIAGIGVSTDKQGRSNSYFWPLMTLGSGIASGFPLWFWIAEKLGFQMKLHAHAQGIANSVRSLCYFGLWLIVTVLCSSAIIYVSQCITESWNWKMRLNHYIISYIENTSDMVDLESFAMSDREDVQKAAIIRIIKVADNNTLGRLASSYRIKDMHLIISRISEAGTLTMLIEKYDKDNKSELYLDAFRQLLSIQTITEEEIYNLLMRTKRSFSLDLLESVFPRIASVPHLISLYDCFPDSEQAALAFVKRSAELVQENPSLLMNSEFINIAQNIINNAKPNHTDIGKKFILINDDNCYTRTTIPNPRHRDYSNDTLLKEYNKYRRALFQ